MLFLAFEAHQCAVFVAANKNLDDCKTGCGHAFVPCFCHASLCTHLLSGSPRDLLVARDDADWVLAPYWITARPSVVRNDVLGLKRAGDRIFNLRFNPVRPCERLEKPRGNPVFLASQAALIFLDRHATYRRSR